MDNEIEKFKHQKTTKTKVILYVATKFYNGLYSSNNVYEQNQHNLESSSLNNSDVP